ncbi:MAG TPA: hypothetical protein VLA75_10175 [Thermoanaerobaculia bacterium]|nr:hypothetical protein [Thermoanaerobaculia bacterium]
MSATTLSYLPIEIQSFLPSGWGLVEGAEPRWDGRKGAWSIAVYDPADNDWEIRVATADAARQGRLEALKLAVDEVFHRSLR